MRTCLIAASLLCCVACGGPQSALAPAGADAERAAELFYWMTWGAAIIWAAVLALALWLPRLTQLGSPTGGIRLIVGGGIVLPVVVLSLLLVFGLASLRAMLRPGDDPLSLEIVGSQWWWRVRYVMPGVEPIETANEIRLPLGRRVVARVMSGDVIHSFWLPSIAGKMDMIPGRINRVQLEPTRAGTFRGACAEFCGTSHARMNLIAIVMDNDAFETWLQSESRPYQAAAAPEDVRRGEATFFEHGCNTCHTIRGTTAAGVVGPDLTHVGARHTIAAGLLPMSPDHLQRWIRNTVRLKPDARMPAFDAMPDEVVGDLVSFLTHLR